MRLLLVMGLAACSSDAFFLMPPPRDGAAESAGEAGNDVADGASASDTSTSPDAPQDASVDAACLQHGGAACDQVMDAYCARLKACCNGGCGYSWTEDMTACRAHFAAQTENCASSQFTNKMVCYSDTSSCANAMQAGTCNVIMGANPRALCSMFWGQFP